MAKKEIENLVEKALYKIYPLFESFQKEGINVLVGVPKEKEHGDYSTNVSLVLSKKLDKNPFEVAKEIASEIDRKESASWRIEKIEVASPGFINFYLSKDFFIENLAEILRDKNFGANKNLKGKKIIIEYTDPNPFKKFHIGHLNNNAVGEAMSRIFEFHGASVKRANYQGDVGLHVAKSIWGKISKPNLEWGEAYMHGHVQYEDNEIVKKDIDEINKKVYAKSDENINKLYKQGREETLAEFEKIYQKIGTKFNCYFFESEVADFGKKIVNDHPEIFEKGEKGAIIFKGESFEPKTHTRVFINSEGLPTYEAKELGLAKKKYDEYKYDQSVVITGNEIKEYFKVLLSAMAQVFPDLAKKTKHIGHGMLRLPEGKMSSRKGNVVTAESLIEKVKKGIKAKIGERDLNESDVEKIAIGAIKYSILKQSIGKDIIYDFEKSISFEGDSGPYLQYSYVRSASVLEKAKVEKIKPSLKNVPLEITQLEKIMSHFPEAVEKAGMEYQPHFIILYLTELAREFNNYYAHNTIVDKNDEFSPYKVALTQAFSIIMKNGLWLLGIQVPDKM